MDPFAAPAPAPAPPPQQAMDPFGSGPVSANDQVNMFGAAPAPAGGGGCFDPFASSAPAPAPAAPVADDSGFGFPDAGAAAASSTVSVADRRRQQRETAGTAGFGNVPKGQVNFDAFGSPAPAPAAPAPAPARAASTSAVNNYQDQYEDEEDDEESEEEGFDDDEDHGVSSLSLQDDEDSGDEDLEYDAIFEPSYGAKLGVLMERVDDTMRGATSERAVVKMVVENGAAMRAGVTQGSVLLAVNGESVKGKSYLECLDMIKKSGRPMTHRFRKVQV